MQRLTASVVAAALTRGTPYLISVHDGWLDFDQAFIVNDAEVLCDYSDPPPTAPKWCAAAHQRLMP